MENRIPLIHIYKKNKRVCKEDKNKKIKRGKRKLNETKGKKMKPREREKRENEEKREGERR